MQKTAVAADATLRADAPAGEKAESQNKEVKNRLHIDQIILRFERGKTIREIFCNRRDVQCHTQSWHRQRNWAWSNRFTSGQRQP